MRIKELLELAKKDYISFSDLDSIEAETAIIYVEMIGSNGIRMLFENKDDVCIDFIERENGLYKFIAYFLKDSERSTTICIVDKDNRIDRDMLYAIYEILQTKRELE